MTYTHILDLAKEAEPPSDGIMRRTILENDQIKAVVFVVLREGRSNCWPLANLGTP
jgi:hypothetical protein